MLPLPPPPPPRTAVYVTMWKFAVPMGTLRRCCLWRSKLNWMGSHSQWSLAFPKHCHVRSCSAGTFRGCHDCWRRDRKRAGKEALLVMTRERKRREQAEAIWLASRMKATSKPLVNLSLDGELLTAAGTQCSSSRVEPKRSGEEVAGGRDAELAGESGKTANPDPIPEREPLKASSEQLKETQRKEETLQPAWRWANGDGPQKENVTFFVNSLLSGSFLIKFSSLSAPTKIEELTAVVFE